MEWVARIDTIEQRAKRINISIYKLCRETGVPQANLVRWKKGGNPSMRTLSRDLGRLEDALDHAEWSLRRALSPARVAAAAA